MPAGLLEEVFPSKVARGKIRVVTDGIPRAWEVALAGPGLMCQ